MDKLTCLSVSAAFLDITRKRRERGGEETPKLCRCSLRNLSLHQPMSVYMLTVRPVAVKSTLAAFFMRTDTRFSSSDIRPIELLAPQSPLPTRPCLPETPAVRLNQRLMENSLNESYALPNNGMDIMELRELSKKPQLPPAVVQPLTTLTLDDFTQTPRVPARLFQPFENVMQVSSFASTGATNRTVDIVTTQNAMAQWLVPQTLNQVAPGLCKLNQLPPFLIHFLAILILDNFTNCLVVYFMRFKVEVAVFSFAAVNTYNTVSTLT